MTSSSDQIVIIGGGFSGAMAAARLAERGMASTLIDAGGDFGLGVAYSTPFDGHLLNVRSNRMSATDGRTDDFVDWLGRNHPDRADPEGFAPRRLYGLYVQDRLRAVETEHPGLITRLHARAASIEGTDVVLGDGRRISGRAVVLATGNPPPRTASGDARILSDPWVDGALSAIQPDDFVLVIGTGLTMVDMAVWLDDRGWRGRMLALSRRGLRPRAHGERPDGAIPPDPQLLEGPASARLKAARVAVRAGDWRGVMEGLRPLTDQIWRAADVPTRARWVRHLRPWWDVHRHRIAPGIAARLDALIAADRLTLNAARIRSIAPEGDKVAVTFDLKGRIVPRTILADWLIDCTGPGHDPARDPLTGPLVSTGRARLDPLRLGLDLDDSGRVLAADGTPDPTLMVLGPPARATFWETVAVPDIRKRIEVLVGTLAE
ncbi:MAG: FAD/NAD(P)-binding protein [Brevundimonas sp.]|uniref:FAD/NAD(P)-binding protein n=1 Tax=Brevundimonas sp. TaxID=1871086 RepID=UPI0027722461|nr:FAD/NAD(P)-binding protein [Brevundimonas sp.]MDP3400105.1 FAD/NAD(P)-binding protein [Brevundimonas sp.]MDZ4108623.1 FAD/NAD(P)-binding protein [Brevundimonas sp.]